MELINQKTKTLLLIYVEVVYAKKVSDACTFSSPIPKKNIFKKRKLYICD